MQLTTSTIQQIDNGYIVTVYPPPAAGQPMPQAVHQYCADKNAVAGFLLATFVPGATYTPPPA